MTTLRFRRGVFITVEGIEGAGKTTLVREIKSRLEVGDRRVLTSFEPGGTALGRDLRAMVLAHRSPPPDPVAELLLFGASRAHLVRHVLRPALEAGWHVICDRYADSSVGYQAYGRGLSLETVDTVNRIATGGLRPDLTVLLDIAVETGLSRKSIPDSNRFEEESVQFHERVRQGFLTLAASEPARWIVCDASAPVETVVATVWTSLLERFQAMGLRLDAEANSTG